MTSPLIALTGRALAVVALAALVGVVAIGNATPRVTEADLPVAAPQPSLVPLAAEPPVAAAEALPPQPQPAVEPAAPTTPGARTTTEVVPGAPEVDGLPPSPAAEPLIAGGAPAPASEAGALVDGFPEALPIVDGSKIVSSSVNSSDNRVQATVVARTARSSDDVVALYEESFAALGLPGSPVPSASGTRSFAFSRDSSSVTLTVGPAGSGSEYTLFAVIAL